MPEIEEELLLDVSSRQVHFVTRQNGDRIDFRGLQIGPNRAATLAWLINQDAILELQLKIKE